MNILRLPKLLYSCVAFCCCQALTVSLSAQQQKADTARTYSIPEVTVAEAYHTREVRAMAPTQVFSKEELKSLNVLQVSDAVKHFAGVTVKDYGGIGGLKTVSLRSLGAEHTAVGYDGITISDCQTGQIDIGRFSLDNVDRLSLSNGQSDHIPRKPLGGQLHQRAASGHARALGRLLLCLGICRQPSEQYGIFSIQDRLGGR